MHIGGIQKCSLLDYPDKISAIIFTQGCNFRCPYCHNPELLGFSEGIVPEEEIIEFLKTRIGKLDAVVITGGEPTMQTDLIEFMSKIKELGFLIKLDTNGTKPTLVKELIKKKLIDYVAMDIKAPLEKYKETVQVGVPVEKIKESIAFIINSGVDYEFRTTIVKEQLSFEDFEEIGKEIKGAKKYFLQKFVPSKIFDETYIDKTTYSDDEFHQITSVLRNYVNLCDVR